jgi:hypothetical protein
MALDNIESSFSSSLTIMAISLWAVMMATFFVALNLPQDEITQTQLLSQAIAMDNEGGYRDPASGNRYLVYIGTDDSKNNSKAGKAATNFSNNMVLPTSIITTTGPNDNLTVNTNYILRTVPIIVNNSGDMRFQSWTVQAGYDSFKPPEPEV